MHTAYFDVFSGASGDMIVGALLGLGAKIKPIQDGLSRLKLPERFTVSKKLVTRAGISAVKFSISMPKKTSSDNHRSYEDIKKIIERSEIPATTKKISQAIFLNLAKAESKIHRAPVEKVQFHEVGALDSIIDIVAASLAWEQLKIKRAYCSPLTVGAGTAEAAHGSIPLPSPATLELIRGIPTRQRPGFGELLTPTGAAIIKTLCDSFGTMPAMKIEAIGYGAGDKNPVGHANALRILGGSDFESGGKKSETAWVVETNIDDMSPELVGNLQEQLFETGALEVFTTPVLMKKNRPGFVVSAICDEKTLRKIIECFFVESTTFGLRYHPVSRACLDRQSEMTGTSFGAVRIKTGRLDGKLLTSSPEYEDCRQISKRKKIPLRKVFEDANKKANQQKRR